MVNDAELGQGITTTFAMLVAEELDLPLERMRFELAPAEPRYYDPNQHAMATGGSRSTKSMGPTMRQAGATARAMLVAAAAQRWNVDPATCTTANGVVTGPSGQTAKYADLLELAATMPVPGQRHAQDAGSFSRHRHARAAARRSAEDQRPRRLRHRRQSAGDAVRFDREAARDRRPRRIVRCERRAEGSGRPRGRAGHLGRGGRRRQHLGGVPGPQGAERDLRAGTERRPLDRVALRATRARSCRRRASCCGNRQRRRDARGGQARQRELRDAVPRARDDGTDERDRRRARRPRDDLAPDAVADQRATGSGADHRLTARSGHGEPDVLRRRVRPARRDRLRHRRGRGLEGDRRARESRVDARGRHPQRSVPTRHRARALRNGGGRRHDRRLPPHAGVFVDQRAHVAGAREGRRRSGRVGRLRQFRLRDSERAGRLPHARRFDTGRSLARAVRQRQYVRHRIVRRRARARGGEGSARVPPRQLGRGPSAHRARTRGRARRLGQDAPGRPGPRSRDGAMG